MCSVLVAGSTGAIGRCLVRQALLRPEVGTITALTRKVPTAENSVETMFGLEGPDKNLLGEVAQRKLCVTAINWEDYCRFWSRFSALSISDQAQLEQGVALSQETSEEHHGRVESRTSALETLREDYQHYKKVLGGHAYASICLGTTKKDAGSSEKFIRCDYTYVLALVEGLLCFSGKAGWDVVGDAKPFPLKDTTDTTLLSPSWLSYRFGDPSIPPKNTPMVSTNDAASSALQSFYKEEKEQRAGERFAILQGRSSMTLRGISLVSCTGANISSWLTYLRVKGATEEAVAERVLVHNKLCRFLSEPADASSALRLSILRPGALNRGEKARLKEKVLLFLMCNSAITVETCGQCLLHDCIHLMGSNSSQGTAGLPLEGLPYPNEKIFNAAREPLFNGKLSTNCHLSSTRSLSFTFVKHFIQSYGCHGFFCLVDARHITWCLRAAIAAGPSKPFILCKTRVTSKLFPGCEISLVGKSFPPVFTRLHLLEGGRAPAISEVTDTHTTEHCPNSVLACSVAEAFPTYSTTTIKPAPLGLLVLSLLLDKLDVPLAADSGLLLAAFFAIKLRTPGSNFSWSLRLSQILLRYLFRLLNRDTEDDVKKDRRHSLSAALPLMLRLIKMYPEVEDNMEDGEQRWFYKTAWPIMIDKNRRVLNIVLKGEQHGRWEGPYPSDEQSSAPGGWLSESCIILALEKYEWMNITNSRGSKREAVKDVLSRVCPDFPDAQTQLYLHALWMSLLHRFREEYPVAVPENMEQSFSRAEERASCAGCSWPEGAGRCGPVPAEKTRRHGQRDRHLWAGKLVPMRRCRWLRRCILRAVAVSALTRPMITSEALRNALLQPLSEVSGGQRNGGSLRPLHCLMPLLNGRYLLVVETVGCTRPPRVVNQTQEPLQVVVHKPRAVAAGGACPINDDQNSAVPDNSAGGAQRARLN
eukprot:gene6758-4849_t